MLPFLQFALEIRLEVYENLPTKTPRVAHAICLDHFNYSFPHSILCTNKQIRSEAEPILYRDNAYNHYIERDFRRKTYALPIAQRRLSTTIFMCPLLRSIHIHLVFPFNFETADMTGPETISLTERMQWTCQVLQETSSVEEILISTRKQAPISDILQADSVALMRGLLSLSQKYRKVLAPLSSLPATMTLTYRRTRPCRDETNSSSTERYEELCEQLLCEHLQKMLSERVVSVGSSGTQAPTTG